MEFAEYIHPELLVLIPVLYLIGMGLKNSRTIQDRLIPLLLGGGGVLLGVAYMLVYPSGLTLWQNILSGLLQGILCAGMAVYGNQIYKQTCKSGECDGDTQPPKEDEPPPSDEDTKG